MLEISTIIITKNEQESIVSCVEHALSFSKEVIVIDNDSIDDTNARATAAGAKTCLVKGLDFSYIRNVGKEQAQFPWILYLDTDERLSDSLKEEIVSLSEDRKESAYVLHRINYFFGKRWPVSDNMIRLIKKDALIGWIGTVHETAHVTGVVGSLKGDLIHKTHNDLRAMVKKTNEWSDIEAQLRYKSHHPQMTWWRFFRVMISAFWKSYITDKGWKVGTAGVVESLYQSCSMFITYAKLWEKQTAKRKR